MRIFRTDLRWDINQKLKSNLINKLQSTTYVFAAAVLMFSSTAGLLVGTVVANHNPAPPTIELDFDPGTTVNVGGTVQITAEIIGATGDHDWTVSASGGELSEDGTSGWSSDNLEFPGAASGLNSVIDFYFKSDVADTYTISVNSIRVHPQQPDHGWDITETQEITVNSPPVPATGEVQIAAYVCEDGTSVNWSANGPEGNVPETCAPLEGAQFGYVKETDNPIGHVDGPYLFTPVEEYKLSNENGHVIFSDLSDQYRHAIIAFDGSNNPKSNSEILFYACEDDSSNGGNANDNYEFAFPDVAAAKQCVAYFADTELPSTESPLIAPESNSLHNSPITISGVSTDNLGVDSVNIYVKKTTDSDYPDAPEKVVENDDNDSPFEWSTPWTPDQDGTYDIKAAAVDTSGNEENSAEATNVTYDSTKPTIEILSPDANTAHRETLQIDVKAQDNGSGIGQVVVNLHNADGHVAPCVNENAGGAGNYEFTCNIDTTLHADGNYFIKTNARDMAGNLSQTLDRSFVFDNTKPKVKVETPTNGILLNSSDFTVEGTASDDETSVVEVKYTVTRINAIGGNYVANIDSGVATGTSDWEFDVVGLSDGYYRLKVQAFDEAGNWKYHYNDVEVDITAPAQVEGLQIRKGHSASGQLLGCDGYTNTQQIRVEWNHSPESDVAGYWFGTKFSEKHAWVPVGTNYYHGNMTPGHNPYHYTVIAVDHAGNESVISKQCGLVLDTDAPLAEIVQPNDGDILRGTAVLRGEVTDDNPMNSYFRIVGPNDYMEDDLFSDGRSVHEFVWNTSDLEDGEYTIYFETRDKAGNKDGSRSDPGDSVDVIVVTVDNSAPVIEIENVLVSDEGLLSFDLSAFDVGPAGLKHVAANIYNEHNTGSPLISLGSGNPTRLNDPHAGLPVGTPSFNITLENIDVSILEDGIYTIRAFARDHAGNELRFELKQFEVELSATDAVGGGNDDDDEDEDTEDGVVESSQTTSGQGNDQQVAVQQRTTASSGFQERENDQAVLSDETDENGSDENGANGQEDGDEQTAASDNGFAWWWILVLLAGGSILYLVLRRRKHQDKN